MNYQILLPPSEGKNIGGINSFKCENNDVIYLISLIKDFLNKEESDAKIEKLLELKGKKLEEAKRIMSNLFDEKTLRSIDRYSGVMFKAINYSDFTKVQKSNFDSSVLFIDGLFGVLKPQDQIPNYKLKITSKVDGLSIAKYWKEKLNSFFEKEFKDKIIIDILPLAHRKVINYSSAKELYKINFFDKIGPNKYKNAGHFSKQLKGELIGYLSEKEDISLDYLKKFKHKRGYEYCKEISKKSDEINFAKTINI